MKDFRMKTWKCPNSQTGRLVLSQSKQDVRGSEWNRFTMDRDKQINGLMVFLKDQKVGFEGVEYLIRPLFRHAADVRHVWSQDDVCLLQARS